MDWVTEDLIEVPGEAITTIWGFEGEYRFLSNFSPSPVLYEGNLFPSVEHAYQYAKGATPEEKARIFSAFQENAGDPAAAKKIGRGAVVRADWDEVKVPIMYELLTKKFLSPDLRRRLLDTEPLELYEANWWHDKFWGVDDKTGEGKNTLGELLMRVRANATVG